MIQRKAICKIDMSENKTLDYYNKNASSFAEKRIDVDFHDTQKHFQELLPEQDTFLDFGMWILEEI